MGLGVFSFAVFDASNYTLFPKIRDIGIKIFCFIDLDMNFNLLTSPGSAAPVPIYAGAASAKVRTARIKAARAQTFQLVFTAQMNRPLESASP